MTEKTVCLNADHPLVVNSRKLTASMMIPKPWNVKALVKNGLLEMYIMDSFMRIFNISAEKDASVKLICPNPVYVTVYRHLHELIDGAYGGAKEEELSELFSKLRGLKELQSGGVPCPYKYWTGLIPDFRTLTTPCDGMSWIYSVLVKGGKVMGGEV